MRSSKRLLWTAFFAVVLALSAVHAEDEDIDVDIEDDDEVDPSEIPELKIDKPNYVQPKANGETFFTATFESEEDFKSSWIVSAAKKDDIDDEIAKYDGQWAVEEPEEKALIGDMGLVLKSRAKHHAVAAKLKKPFTFDGKPFVVQYEVKFQNGQECGGAYIKLLSQNNKLDLKKFTDKTGYTIMFGPDKCGNDNKLHFIFRHQNPITGEFEEKHAKKPTAPLESYFTDKKSHIFTLVIKPSNDFEIFVDQTLVNSGNLLEDMTPPINPSKEIIDPNDKKPEDWDEREKIPDPDATKPEDWDEDEPEMIDDESAEMPSGWLEDEPELIPDPDSEMPADWDEDMDGEWEPPMINNLACEAAPGCGEWTAPMIKNPEYKGKWRAPMIENANYKGKWKARKIPNPDYFEDSEPYKMTAIGAIGLELWSMSDNIMFDNFIITNDKAVADQWGADSWEIKHRVELAGVSSGRSVVGAIMDATNERPWLWAVFIVVIILPIVLIIAYCCMPGSSPKPEDIRARAKKTDAPSPDDKPAEKQEEEAEEDDEEDPEEEKVEEKAEPEAAGDAKPAKAKKSDLDAEQETNEADNEEDEEGEASGPATRSSPRKRKTKARKD